MAAAFKTYFSFILALALVLEPMAAARAAEGDDRPTSTIPAGPQSIDPEALPIAEIEMAIHDEKFGDGKVILDYTETHNEDEDALAREWLKKANREGAEQGEENALIAASVDNDQPEAQLQVSPEELSVPRENVIRPVIKLSAFQEFRGAVAGKIQDLKDFIAKKKLERQLEKLELEKLEAQKRAGERTLNRYDAFLKDLTETDVPTKVPALIRLARGTKEKVRNLKKYAHTFARARFVVVGTAVALSFYFTRSLDPRVVAASLLTAVLFGYGSRTIQLLGSDYMAWLQHLGTTSNKIIRAPVRAAARLMGKTETEIKVMDDNFKRSQVHNILHSAIKFMSTEQPFLLAAPIVFGIFGLAYYPLVDAAHGINFFDSPLFPFNYFAAIGLQMLISTVNAYVSQGLLDIGNSNVRAGELHEIAFEANRGKVSLADAVFEKRRIEFRSGVRMLVVSAVSNFGVVLAQTPNPGLRTTGNAVVWGMAAVGGLYYTYSVLRYDAKFKDWLRQKLPRFGEWLYGEPNFDYHSCVDFLKVRKTF